MKLYNLLEDIILEERRLITENVSKADIYDALDSHKRIRIYYQGAKETNPEVRLVDVYAYGLSSANNEVIRVYQAFGTTTSKIGWKLMRVDRISGWQPTGFRFSEKALANDPSIPIRNEMGDNSMSNVFAVAKFGPNDISSKDVNKTVNTNNTNTNKTVNTNNVNNNVNKNVNTNNVNKNNEKEFTSKTPSRYDN